MKFNLVVATTNHPAFKADPAAFWQDHTALWLLCA
jgi:hypothetical protein